MEQIFFEMQIDWGGPCVPGLGVPESKEAEKRADPSSRLTMG